jgi:hypothetical protein
MHDYFITQGCTLRFFEYALSGLILVLHFKQERTETLKGCNMKRQGEALSEQCKGMT